jgi:Flp pilus assembly protein TadD
LNASGYQLLAVKKPADAINVFKLVVQLYPQSWNAYDSLGEAYASAGQKELAIANYEKSIQLNPKN